MRHAAGQFPHRFHLLGLAELIFDGLMFGHIDSDPEEAQNFPGRVDMRNCGGLYDAIDPVAVWNGFLE